MMSEKQPILISGATGYVGGLIAAAVLAHTDRPLVLLVRPGKERRHVVGRLLDLTAERGGYYSSSEYDARITLLPLPEDHETADLAGSLRPLGIGEIVHAAGCLDYFASTELESGNVGLTRRIAELAGRLSGPRLLYISTAFSSGYVQGEVREAAHGDPAGGDPTDYTLTKRAAERLVTATDAPWLIVRPSVLIGNSRSGRYDGKRYGLYQLWMGIERLLCDQKHEEMHIGAPLKPINFLHQDSFQNALALLLQLDWTERFVNLVSSNEITPCVRDLWELWFSAVGRPSRVYYYDDVDSVPMARLHPRQRAYTMFAIVNMRIAAHGWTFETTALNELRRRGLKFADATLAGIEVCQQRFLRNSAKMRAYIARYAAPPAPMATGVRAVVPPRGGGPTRVAERRQHGSG